MKTLLHTTLAALAAALLLTGTAAARDFVDPRDMRAYCTGRAVDYFDTQRRFVTTDPIYRNDRGAYFVDGFIRGGRFAYMPFRCRFGNRGAFAEIRALR